MYPKVFSIFYFFQDYTGNCWTRFYVNVNFLDNDPWSITEEPVIEFPLRSDDFGCGLSGERGLDIYCWKLGACGFGGWGVIETLDV